jgi:acyl-CoA thioester hydrolase
VSEFSWPVRVYYEDTDAAGMVYHANYLRFMERARTEWLRRKGFEQDQLRDRDGILFAVTRAKVDFLRPALFNQALSVSVCLTRRGRASLEIRQEVRGPGGEVCCRGELKLACLDAVRLRPRPIPERLLAELSDVE